MAYVVEGAARLDFSNTPGSRPAGAPDNGQVLIQQADGVLLTRKRDGTVRETDLRPLLDQITDSAPGARAALGVPLVPTDPGFQVLVTAIMAAWLKSLPVAADGSPNAPVAAGQPYLLGPGGPLVIAQ